MGGLMVLDRAPAADDLLDLEDLDLAGLCSCACGPASHTSSECSQCPCSARCDLDLAAESLESAEVENEVAARVVALLKAARAHRTHLDGERRDREAMKPRVITGRKKAPAAEPKAPAAPPPADEDGRFDEDALEAVLAG